MARRGSKRSALGAMRAVAGLEPRTEAQLARFVRVVLGLAVPVEPVVSGHQSPMEYLSAAFFEPGRDVVVWASRGGGKTMLGAAATLLDLLFKPGVQVRILGGSLEQSERMHRYLRQLADRPMLAGVLASQPTGRRLTLVNGSGAEVLAQSQRSVRGVRVHKLRCDEVEEFRPEVWDAAQRVTRSGRCGEVEVAGTIEALSTMHRPGGLMSELVDGGKAKVVRWCALDVVERCGEQRRCEGCVLWNDCQGRARRATGFVGVEDLVAQWRRSSAESWASEMMCRRPSRRDSVYPGFDADLHVSDGGERGSVPTGGGAMVVGGMDFGMRSPRVMLWAVARREGASAEDWPLEVVDEHVASGVTLEKHLGAIEARGWKGMAWIGVDPAGAQRNGQTGESDVQVLRRRGYAVRLRASAIRDGVERIRRRLDRGTLRIHRRCERLIEAMNGYHFDPRHVNREEPVKDGPDHLCDALRYLVVNLEAGGTRAEMRRY